jgi:hypothetical protein
MEKLHHPSIYTRRVMRLMLDSASDNGDDNKEEAEAEAEQDKEAADIHSDS